jgi:hypothetical protein
MSQPALLLCHHVLIKANLGIFSTMNDQDGVGLLPEKQKGGTSSAPPFSLRFHGPEKTGRNQGKI